VSENGNGKSTKVSISTLVKTTFSGGDFHSVISQLLQRKPTGTLVVHLSEGGINGVELTEKTKSGK
jgi:hypothetical protein